MTGNQFLWNSEGTVSVHKIKEMKKKKKFCWNSKTKRLFCLLNVESFVTSIKLYLLSMIRIEPITTADRMKQILAKAIVGSIQKDLLKKLTKYEEMFYLMNKNFLHTIVMRSDISIESKVNKINIKQHSLLMTCFSTFLLWNSESIEE